MDEELIPTAPAALDVPQELILSIAMGMEDPKEVASRYGYEGLKWEMLSAWKPFTDAVAAKKAELETSGITFKIKAKALTEDVFEDAYRIARANDTTLLQKLEFVKLGAKLGDMEPKTNTQVQTGPGFSITINLSPPKTEPLTIDAVEEVAQIEQTEAVEEAVVAEFKTKRKKKA
jgi:hypothetical protein